MIEITVSATNARIKMSTLPITTGLVGFKAKFNFSSEWDDLTKLAVCTGSGVTKDATVELDGQFVIPHECVATAGGFLKIGVYGTDSNGTLIIPTVYCNLGIIQEGAEPSGDETITPTQSVFDQMLVVADAAKTAAETAAANAATSEAKAESSADSAAKAATNAAASSTKAVSSETAAAAAASAAKTSAEAAAKSAAAADVEGFATAAAKSAAEAKEAAETALAATSNAHHYTAVWDMVQAQMIRANDATNITTTITNFCHRGSVNTSYSNPFDSIYPWSGIRLCNIDVDLYMGLKSGDSITDCIVAWEGDADFDYDHEYGVWVYRPEFWGNSWSENGKRYFDVTDKAVGGYVHYAESVEGRWHGQRATKSIGGTDKTILLPKIGIPSRRYAVSTMHGEAKNYGATLDSIFTADASALLMVVEYATMNMQSAIGNGVTSLYRESSDLIKSNVSGGNVIQVDATAGSGCCISGAVIDIGTSNGGAQVGSYIVQSAATNASDSTIMDVVLDAAVTVTTANYWSIHGLAAQSDSDIGSKSGYIGTNGKSIVYYRGKECWANMFFYTLGAYRQKNANSIWVAHDIAEADAYDTLDDAVHYDTGLAIPINDSYGSAYIKALGTLSRSGLLAIPPICTESGGNSTNPVGDRAYWPPVTTENTILLLGGNAGGGAAAGPLYGYWGITSAYSDWDFSGRPVLRNP